MKDFRKHLISFSVFLSAVFLVLLLGYLLSGEASALQRGKKIGRKAPAPLPKTGQTISYVTGDDGYWQKGVAWPVPRFSDNGDGTVTDNLTNLMWTKSARQIPSRYIWQDAVTVCNQFVFAGYDDWRLPNAKEFLSLIDYSQGNPALPPGHPFTDITYGDPWETIYWTSTTAFDPNAAWFMRVGWGDLNFWNKNGNPLESPWAWPLRDAR